MDVPLARVSPSGSSTRSIWPDVMTAELADNVTETTPTSLGGIADGLGGRFLFLVGCVGLIAIFAKTFRASESTEATRGIALIVAVWFLAALALSFRGPRFIMLMVPPFAISVGAAVGMFDHAHQRPHHPQRKHAAVEAKAIRLPHPFASWCKHSVTSPRPAAVPCGTRRRSDEASADSTRFFSVER